MKLSLPLFALKMQELHPTSNLIHGCEIISKGLRYKLCPMGHLFQFDGLASGRPRPLTLLRVATLFVVTVVLIIISFISLHRVMVLAENDERVIAITRSAFLNLFGKIFGIYRVLVCLAICIVIVARHCTIASVVANRTYFVKEEEQSRLAKVAIAVILIKIFVSVGSLFSVLADQYVLSGRDIFITLSGFLCIFGLNLVLSAPMIYTCYLGSALGKHVENFSEIYIDTMFDQFMNAIEAERDPEALRLAAALEEAAASSDKQQASSEKWPSNFWRCCGLCALIRRLIIGLCLKIRAVAVHLNARKYPELPEMKMTKLSSTTSIKISDAARVANSQLIRARLRKTQIMLSELRDMVNDINKMSSPIVMMHFIMDMMIIILVTTASIQAKLYKSISVLIIPTVAYTIGTVMGVVFVCICLDETSSQLKLMTNKLFDFIIMNHRVQSSSSSPPPQQGKHFIAAAAADGFSADTSTSTTNVARGFVVGGGKISSCGCDSVEEEALSETWSQFQYTRKLSNTIQFTMGGILTVTRRLALPILGNILSAVFISIEVMSIIDTSGHEESSSTRMLVE